MSRWARYLLVTVCVISSSGAWAQLPPPLITDAQARRHGLERAWIARVQIGGTDDKIASVVYYQPEPAAAPAGQLRPMPPAAADAPKPAAQPGRVAEAGILVVVTERGLMHVFDAETGQTQWVQQIGDRNKFHSPPAINGRFIAIMEGTTLHVLERATGSFVQSAATNAIIMTAPAISEEWVYVPSLRGELFAFRLPVPESQADKPADEAAGAAAKAGEKPQKRSESPTKYFKQEAGAEYSDENRWYYSSFGRIDVPPLALRSRLAWATSRGHLYTSSLDRAAVRGRFETSREITAPLSYWPPYVFLASRDGYVYAVPETTTSSIAWRYPAGEAVTHKPVAIDDAVYIIPENNNLHCVGMQDGAHRWTLPGIAQFLSASPTRLYLKDYEGQLQIADRKTGTRLSQFDIERLTVTVTNDRSDRIFLGAPGGLLMCLREPALRSPAVHIFPTEAEVLRAAKEAGTAHPAAAAPADNENRDNN